MNDPLDVIPGAKTLEDIVGALDTFSKFLVSSVHAFNPDTVLGAMHQIGEHLADASQHIKKTNWEHWSHLSTYSGTTLFDSLLSASLGLETDKFDKDAKSGIKTVDTFFGFIMALTYGGVALDVAAKTILANRIPEHWMKPILELPQELGMSWAIGTFIETVLEAAVGRSIEEGIAEQKRPNRLGWPELRTLFKQHILKEADADKWLAKLGYPPDQIDLIKQLVTNQVPVGDLQQMYLYEIRDKHEIHDAITAMGFSNKDAHDLIAMYIDKIQTSSGSMYRSTARQLASRDLISEHQYRAILEHTHVPPREIHDDLAAIQLEKDHGRLSTSISTLKSLFVRGKIQQEHVQKELAMLGYSDDAIKDIIKAWNLPSSTRPHGLSQAKILSYYISGIIKTEDARNLLLGSNIRADTVEFLLEHPAAGSGVHMRQLSPGVVIEAYVTGALTVDDLPDAFKRAHVPEEQIPYYLSIAKYRKLHAKKAGDATIPLAKGDIISAFKFAIYDQQTAQQELEHLGYSSEDATILLEIENKGIFQPSTPPVFKDLQSAIAFMQAHGYTVVPPPNPLLTAAEQVLAGAGYSWYLTPPPGIVSQGS